MITDENEPSAAPEAEATPTTDTTTPPVEPTVPRWGDDGAVFSDGATWGE